ncbi:hypothetical protein HYW46_01815 [Candidatus Daviesbacteria bacterium]|nr:hypothetical protein [Candidatus Daviesbacteria bacterium]
MSERLGYLNSEKCCIACLAPRNNKKKGILTADHLVPILACKDYPESLGDKSDSSLEDLSINIFTLCRSCHQKIDSDLPTGKMEMYRLYGILGLTIFLSKYPRSPDADLLIRQHKQLIELFSQLSVRYPLQIALFREAIELLPKKPGKNKDVYMEYKIEFYKINSRIESFLKAHELVDWSLHVWGQGRF